MKWTIETWYLDHENTANLHEYRDNHEDDVDRLVEVILQRGLAVFSDPPGDDPDAFSVTTIYPPHRILSVTYYQQTQMTTVAQPGQEA